jgi:hypothetical protein
MNKFIPKQIKQSDFIKSIFTMYNLFAEVDKDNPKVLNLTTRDKYYDSGAVVNLTKKQSKERETELRFLPELQTKRIVLSYKEDKDITNTTYVQATNEVYGQLEYVYDNEYVREKTKKELIFGPSPIHNTNFGAVLPMVDGQAPKTLPRILFDGGEYACGNYTIENYPGNIVAGQTYPHLSHWDKPTNPTLDINFGTCDFYFRSDDFGNNTNNTLFNLFWRRTMNQINTGKMLTSYFDLNERDIQNLKLNCKVKIDNSYWNINKIIDYDANSNSLTKVELISVDDNIKIPFKRRTINILNAGSPFISNPVGQISAAQAFNKNFIYTNNDVNISGINNIVGETVKQAFIQGDGNTIFDSSMVVGDNNMIDTKASVFGNNNIVNGAAEGSFILGNSITADTASTLFVPNLIISSGGLINGVDVSSVTLFSASTGTNSIIANNGSGNIASGDYAFAEGNSTTASGNDSHAEGYQTTAFGATSHVEGTLNESIGTSSHCEGYQNISSGNFSHCEGWANESLGSASHAEGHNTLSGGDYSHAGGNGGYTKHFGEWARCSHGNGSFGQYGIVDFYKVTNNATTTEIFIGNITNQRFLIEMQEVLRFKITVVAHKITSEGTKEWVVEGLIKNIFNTVSMVGTPLNTSTWSDGGMGTATFAVSADNTNKSLKLEVTGISSNNINWFAKLDYVKVI